MNWNQARRCILFDQHRVFKSEISVPLGWACAIQLLILWLSPPLSQPPRLSHRPFLARSWEAPVLMPFAAIRISTNVFHQSGLQGTAFLPTQPHNRPQPLQNANNSVSLMKNSNTFLSYYHSNPQESSSFLWLLRMSQRSLAPAASPISSMPYPPSRELPGIYRALLLLPLSQVILLWFSTPSIAPLHPDPKHLPLPSCPTGFGCPSPLWFPALFLPSSWPCPVLPQVLPYFPGTWIPGAGFGGCN